MSCFSPATGDMVQGSGLIFPLRMVIPDLTMAHFGYTLLLMVEYTHPLVGGLEHILWISIQLECHHPNWRFVIFFRGVGWNHQAVMFWYSSVSLVLPIFFIYQVEAVHLCALITYVAVGIGRSGSVSQRKDSVGVLSSCIGIGYADILVIWGYSMTRIWLIAVVLRIVGLDYSLPSEHVQMCGPFSTR